MFRSKTVAAMTLLLLLTPTASLEVSKSFISIICWKDSQNLLKVIRLTVMAYFREKISDQNQPRKNVHSMESRKVPDVELPLSSFQ